MMEEWQRRQRAEKEKDRQQKQATAELLSGYRASELDAEAVKLKEIREQERIQRQKAEATLHNFKKLEEPLHKGKSTMTNNDAGKLPVPVNAGGGGGSSQHDEDDNIAFGSVSALMSNFNESFTPSQNSASSANNGTINEVLLCVEAPPLSDTSPPLPPGEVSLTAAKPTVIPNESFVDKMLGKESPVVTPAALPPPITFSFGIITTNISNEGGHNVAHAYQKGLATVLQVSANAIQLQSMTCDVSFPPPAVRYVVTVQVVAETAGITLETSFVYETVRFAIQNGKLWEASCPYKTV